MNALPRRSPRARPSALPALGLALVACASGCTTEPPERALALEETIELLRPLHAEMGPVRSGDWLETHREVHRSFERYVAADPTTAHGERRVIYIQPIGDFTREQRAVVELAAEFLRRFFELEVELLEELPIDDGWPEEARRVHPSWGDRQLLTSYILDELLVPRRPADAAVLLGFTAMDLWPGEGWNFVFGQASLRRRVGVWSIYRNGDPAAGEEELRLCLLRTLKTAAHETGHVFSITHCVAYECGMCGSNNRGESDRRPLAFCPECAAKLCWATGAEPRRRYARLAAFCREHGLEEEARFYDRSAELLE